MEIKLGDKVRCKITGFTGIAISRTEYINGCIQIEVTAKLKKGEKLTADNITGFSIDEGTLERIDSGINKSKPIEKEETGGPTRIGKRMRGY